MAERLILLTEAVRDIADAYQWYGTEMGISPISADRWPESGPALAAHPPDTSLDREWGEVQFSLTPDRKRCPLLPHSLLT